MEKITPVFQNYDWGSKTKLQNLFSEAPKNKKIAEAWFGTHKRGDNISKIYGKDLPYLFKVLAVEKCLSLQIHPNKKTAKLGFASENRRSVPLESAERVFKDPNSKPEMAVALTDFLVVVGVKSEHSKKRFEEILKNKDSKKSKYTSKEYLEKKTREIQKRVKNGTSDSLSDKAFLFARSDYPDDPTALLLLEMNVEMLKPGQSVYLPDGILHAYIRGECLEIMENSDNVFRAGLTNKYINPKLVLDNGLFKPLPSYKPNTVAKSKNWTDYIPRGAGFGIMVGNGNFADEYLCQYHSGPKVLIALDGKFAVNDKNVKKGDAYFIDSKEQILINGSGKFAIAHI
ncbi:MAG: mannose-6-phosphate isomerase, class I [Bifidobacteriaceae bacterium]|jgi:mannose-6-phosphate isomerase|nr:mannose-6-phosphate isomerase, class I [Bifidobacteriaceae bacterium]